MTMPRTVTPKLINWASDVDEGTIEQAARTSRLDVVTGHVALMPDAHVGIGATVGSVIPTEDAIIPAAVGVDIGCGMIAVETNIPAHRLPDDLTPMLHDVERVVPAGVGQGHREVTPAAAAWLRAHPSDTLDGRLTAKALEQFGTLGSGNHFVEVCLDEREVVWVVLHSGSRGVGNQLASLHIDRAKGLARLADLDLEDPDLAYFVQGQPEFDDYITDMLWAQDYALANRAAMMDAVLTVVFRRVPGAELRRVNCHHNFTARETHAGRSLWITRKGAIKADVDDLGVIPGSMGTRSYIVRGLGNSLSWNSCSHGAGRRMSRAKAKKTFTAEDLREQMGDRVWLDDKASELIDEIPTSYKSIDQVMADQVDLVSVEHVLTQVLNFKGTR